ncbi:hypothetical protein JCM10212_006426 [Sporobolomyces blumeae]
MDTVELPVPPPLPRPRVPSGPVLTSTWTRVDQLPPRASIGAAIGTANGARTGVGEEDEWEEDEVEYVTLDFGPGVSLDQLREHGAFQILEPESLTPIVRVGNRYFEGTHETTIGTQMLFKQTGSRSSDDPPALEPFSTTHHRIQFQPVSITAKDGSALDAAENGSGATEGQGGPGAVGGTAPRSVRDETEQEEDAAATPGPFAPDSSASTPFNLPFADDVPLELPTPPPQFHTPPAASTRSDAGARPSEVRSDAGQGERDEME